MASLIFRVFTLSSVSLSRIHYQSINFFAKSLFIHYHFREFTMASLINRVLTLNLLFLSRIHYGFFIFIANSLSIHYLFGKFTMYQYFWRTFFEFIFSFANSLGIHYFFANSLWIYYLFREFTIVPLIDRVFTLNLLSRSRIHYGFINLSRIDPEFTIFFANSLSFW